MKVILSLIILIVVSLSVLQACRKDIPVTSGNTQTVPCQDRFKNVEVELALDFIEELRSGLYLVSDAGGSKYCIVYTAVKRVCDDKTIDAEKLYRAANSVLGILCESDKNICYEEDRFYQLQTILSMSKALAKCDAPVIDELSKTSGVGVEKTTYVSCVNRFISCESKRAILLISSKRAKIRSNYRYIYDELEALVEDSEASTPKLLEYNKTNISVEEYDSISDVEYSISIIKTLMRIRAAVVSKDGLGTLNTDKR